MTFERPVRGKKTGRNWSCQGSDYLTIAKTSGSGIEKRVGWETWRLYKRINLILRV
jgi:hypothetical protein